MKFDLTRRRIGAGIVTASLAAAAVAGTGLSMTANGADAAKFTGVVLGVGVTESSRTLAWYSSTNPTGGENVELATKADFSDKTVVRATLKANVTTEGLAVAAANGKVLLSDLKAKTQYYYRIVEDGTSNVSKTYEFSTGEFGNGDFQFLFFGDPQIGSSGTADADAVADGDGWQYTLAQSRIHSPKAELYVSGGDQINNANREVEWDNFLRPSELTSIPWAATIGNHDVGGYGYEQHFALPTTVDRNGSLYKTPASTTTTSGGDYYYTYKGVLFIDLNSNAYSTANGSDDAHLAFVRNTIKNHKGKAQHVVLVYHHSIYSPADHANDTDNQQRRLDFTKAFSDLGVDLVLQGHDHSYSRSYALKGTAAGQDAVKANAAEQPGASTVVEGPGGVIYVTANSASGSKYYDLTEPDATKAGYGPDTLTGGPETAGHTRHWANSVENQEHVPTYIQVTVNDKGLQVKNIRSGDDTSPNPALRKGNVTGFGPNLAGVAAPIGSVQDQVDIFRDQSDVTKIKDPKGEVTTVTKTETKTVTKEVVPAKLKNQVATKIAQLTKQIKKAKGTKKKTLKAQLAAYKAVQASLK
ncbi:metallophosphoesterase family protein [Nocardioides sp.]|uniref:purple acid phosphatase family protein n=1 Tax=Nocardioides sp. TaxID=35761 RepID=UPI002620E270|nr:metallophosphoesterase family protein [Nocardioides sp.]